MSTSIQNFFSQATGAVKEFLGIDNYPQANFEHEAQYLNDIANGNWGSLRPTVTNISTYPVVGFPLNHYTWNEGNGKIRTDFVRYPFLSQVREGTTLRSTTTNTRKYAPDKGYKMKPMFKRRQVLTEIRTFDRSGLSTRTEPGLLSQAKDIVFGAFGDVKEALGMSTSPQSQMNYERRYLNDIENRNWKLNHVTSVERKMPVVGFPSGFNLYSGLRFKINAPRVPRYLDQIRGGTKLRHIDMPENSLFKWNSKNWRMSKAVDRQQVMNSIREFDRGSLKRRTVQHSKPAASNFMSMARLFVSDHVDSMKEILGMQTFPQARTQHASEYLNDIASGNTASLRHVDEVQEKNGVLGTEWNLANVVEERSHLLDEVHLGCELKHVQTVEKSAVLIEPGFQLKQTGEVRKTLLNDIRGFENESLNHIDIGMGAS